MAGTKAGGAKARETNKERYGVDYYSNIGRVGGSKGRTGGFAFALLCDCTYTDDLHKKAECAGAKGGRASSRLGVPQPMSYYQKRGLIYPAPAPNMFKRLMTQLRIRRV